jgi:hypothetical protein
MRVHLALTDYVCTLNKILLFIRLPLLAASCFPDNNAK